MQVRYGDHHDLVAAGLLQRLQLLSQLLAHNRVDHLGGVYHPPGQRGKSQRCLDGGHTCQEPQRQAYP
ncbi:hypothetical protein D3C81_2316790 [compost metagenome]